MSDGAHNQSGRIDPAERGRDGTVSVRVLARSSVFVNIAHLWQAATRLLVTPIVISALGLEGYGTWALLFTLCGVVLWIHGSLGWATAKLAAECDRKQEYGALAEIVGSQIVLATVVGGGVLATLWVARASIFPTLGVPDPLYESASGAALVLSAGLLLQVSAGTAVPVLGGFQRVDLQYKIEIVGSLADLAIVLPLLYADFGLSALALGHLGRQSLSAAVAWYMCRRLRPALRLSPACATWAGLRRLCTLAVRFQGLIFLALFLRQAPRLVISALCGAGALGAFHLATRLLEVARTPAIGIVNPLMPAFANLGAGRDVDRCNVLFGHASKILALAAAVPLVFAATFAGSILFAWTGEFYPEAAWTVRALSLAEFASLLTGVATAGLRAEGRVRLELTVGIVSGVLVMAGAALGYPVAGYSGILVGVAAGRILGSLIFQWRFAALRGRKFGDHLRAILITPLAPLVPLFLGFAVLAPDLTQQEALSATRWYALARTLWVGFLFALCCGAVTWLLIASRNEREALKNLIMGRGGASRAAT